MRKFAGGLQLHTTDLDDINLDEVGKSTKRPAPPPPLTHTVPVTSVPYPLPPPNAPAMRGQTSVSSGSSWMPPSLSSAAWAHTPHPLPPPPQSPAPLLPSPQTIDTLHTLSNHPDQRMGNHSYQPGGPAESQDLWEVKNYKEKSFSPVSSQTNEQAYLPSPKVSRNTSHLSKISSVSGSTLVCHAYFVNK
uniref:Uncharacterized protein n=1 Tax=Sphaerodactylus townsendi TaxID=933632 RepID=A0ACB8G405_9SAUR